MLNGFIPPPLILPIFDFNESFAPDNYFVVFYPVAGNKRAGNTGFCSMVTIKAEGRIVP